MSGRFDDTLQKPRVGEYHELDLTEMTYSSAAVGRINDMVTFVERGAPHEKVRVEIAEVKKNYLRAHLAAVLIPSQDRCSPPCPYFVEGCGGCQWQHLNVEAQLHAKKRVLWAALKRIGCLQSLPDITCHLARQPLGYRNHVRLVVTAIQPTVAFGFRQYRSHDVTPIEQCDVALPAINAALPQVADLMKRHRLIHANELSLRASATTNAVLLTLVFPRGSTPQINLSEEDLEAYPPIVGVFNRRGNGKANWVVGKQTLEESAGGFRYRIGPDTFFQSNLDGLETLLDLVQGHIKFLAPRKAIDAHCGVGTFTFPLAKVAESVLGIELQPDAIELAALNAQLNGLKNVSFRVGTMGRLNLFRPDLVILNPPRSGCLADDLAALARLAPPHLLYISCNPTTLARDLAVLAPAYAVSAIDLVDHFPMTYHFETVVWLQRRSSAKRLAGTP